MKKILAITLLLCSTVYPSFSNEPTEIDGFYFTINSFEYNYETGEWNELDTTENILKISTDQGIVILGDNAYQIVKTRRKYNRKRDELNVVFILADEKGVRAVAEFVLYQENESGGQAFSQFYLSDSEIDISMDIHDNAMLLDQSARLFSHL